MKEKAKKNNSTLKPIGKRGKAVKKALAEITPALVSASNGRCSKCGKLPDWRGLQRAHKVNLSQGGKTDTENVELICAPCHFGPDGHKTDGTGKVTPRDRTQDWGYKQLHGKGE